jgi:serine/threonine protein kinase
MNNSKMHEKYTLSLDQLTNENKIGSGSYGDVYSFNDDYAVKLFNEAGNSESNIREVSMLKYLNHPNIVKIKGYGHINDNFLVIMEKAKCNLHSQMKNVKKEHRPCIIFQILSALKYMHFENIAHRDIKPHNILIFNNIDIKICDFGCAKNGILHGKTHTGEVSTIWYRAPEVILNPGKYDYSIDIWSTGIILLQLICGTEFPLTGDSNIGQLFRIFKLFGTPNEKNWEGLSKLKYWKEKFPIFKGDLNKILDKYNVLEDEKNILKKMLSWSPNRITAADAMSHPYFTKIISYYKNDCKISQTKTLKTKNQDYINKFDEYRPILFGWLWTVSYFKKLQNSTLLTAYKIIDIYYSNVRPYWKTVQVIGISCLNIAAKLIDVQYFENDHIAELTDNTSTSEIVKITTSSILKYFDYNLIPYIFYYKFNNIDIYNIICGMIISPETRYWEHEKMLIISGMLIKKETSFETELVLSYFDKIIDTDLKKALLFLL